MTNTLREKGQCALLLYCYKQTLYHFRLLFVLPVLNDPDSCPGGTDLSLNLECITWSSSEQVCHVRRPLQSGERTPENRGHPEKTGGRGQRHRGPGVGAWSLRVKNWGGGASGVGCEEPGNSLKKKKKK